MTRTVAYHELLRPLDEADIRVLAGFAGYDAVDCPAPPLPISPGQWHSFGSWFLSYMRLFRCAAPLYHCSCPSASYEHSRHFL